MATSYAGLVTLSLFNNPNGAAAILSGTLTQTPVNGVATFSGLSLNLAGSYTLQATSGNLITTAPTSTLTVTNAAVSQLVVTSQPSPNPAFENSPFSVTVKAEDQFGNTVTGYTKPVTLSAPTGVTLGGTNPVTAVAGVATFSNLTLTPPGTYSLTVKDGTFTASTSSITINAAATQIAVIVAPPATIAAGGTFNVSIQAQDASKSAVTTLNGTTVTLALGTNPGGATAVLGGMLTATFVNGVAAFTGLSLNHVGTGYTIVASATLPNGTVTATTSAINVTASQLVFTTPPPTAIVGVPFNIVVTAEDGLGNTDPAFGGALTLTLPTNPGNAVLAAGISAITVNSGGGGTGYVSTAPPSVLISGGGGTGATASISSTQIVGGVITGITITNPGSGYTSAPTVTIAAPPTGTTAAATAILGTTATAVNGVATFPNLTLNQAATGNIFQVSSTTLPSVSTAQPGFSVVVSPATQLVITTPPPSFVNPNTPFTITVSAESGQGVIDYTFGGTVTLNLNQNPGGATFNTVSEPAVAGVATFAGLSLNQIASGYSYVLGSIGLTQATTGSITVEAPTATHLAVTTPTNQVPNVGFGLTVTAAGQERQRRPDLHRFRQREPEREPGQCDPGGHDDRVCRGGAWRRSPG